VIGNDGNRDQVQAPRHGGLRRRVLEAGGKTLAAYFEDNIVYDDRERSLFSRKLLLRLRRSDRVSLTFKRPIEKAVSR